MVVSCKAFILLCLLRYSCSQNLTTSTRPPGLAALINGGADIFRNQIGIWQGAFNNALNLAGNGLNLGTRLTNQAVNGWTTAAQNLGNTAINLASTATQGGTNMTRSGIGILTSLALPIPLLGVLLGTGGNLGSAAIGGANAAALSALAAGQGILNTKVDLVNSATRIGTGLVENGTTAALQLAANAGNTGFEALQAGFNSGVQMANAGLEAANGVLAAVNNAAESFGNLSNSMAATAMNSLQLSNGGASSIPAVPSDSGVGLAAR